MSAVVRDGIGLLARETALGACWTQWVGLGSPASPTDSRSPRSIIDVEALLLTSLWLSGEERRLRDMVEWWARVGSGLTSVKRLRTLVRRFPGDPSRPGLEAFAGMATASGDKRWARHAGGSTWREGRPSKGRDEPGLLGACALWPRIRAGLGVGAKGDTLAFLLGLAGAGATATSISFATGYSSVAIRQAAGEMALARLIRVTEGRPSQYLAPPRPWGELLDLDTGAPGSEAGIPRWRYWSEIFAFLLGVIQWSEAETSGPEGSQYVLASQARDLLERHGKALTLNNIPTLPPAAFPGRQAAEGLAETTRVVCEWVQEVL